MVKDIFTATSLHTRTTKSYTCRLLHWKKTVCVCMCVCVCVYVHACSLLCCTAAAVVLLLFACAYTHVCMCAQARMYHCTPSLCGLNEDSKAVILSQLSGLLKWNHTESDTKLTTDVLNQQQKKKKSSLWPFVCLENIKDMKFYRANTINTSKLLQTKWRCLMRGGRYNDRYGFQC